MRAWVMRRRGLALVLVLVIVAAMVLIATTVTLALFSHTADSARFAQEVRARALAEAGIESALVHPDQLMDGAFDLEDGSCSVKMTAVKDSPGRRHVVSEGRLRLCRGVLLCRVELVVERKGTDVHILSRSEETRYLPKPPSTEAPHKSAE